MIHPLEYLVRHFFSSDGQLFPETIRQLHLIEGMVALAAFGFLLLFLFYRRRQIPVQKLTQGTWVLIFILAILTRLVSAERGFETMVLFDSVHYTVPASEFLHTGRLTLPINNIDHPTSKSPGFPLLLAPLNLVTDNLGAGVYLNFALGIFSLLLLYACAKKILGEKTALFAFLLLAISPLHITYSRLIMPSMGSLFFILLGSYFLFSSRARGFLLLAGFCFGFSATIRYLTIIAVPAGCLYLFLQTRESYRERFKNIFFLLLGALVPLAGLFYYQWQVFGSPGLTGYSYWEHFGFSNQQPFSLAYGFGIPPVSGGSPNILFNLISATGAYIPFPNVWTSRPDQLLWALIIAVLSLWGFKILFSKNKSVAFFILANFLGLYLPHAFLFSQTGHFMLPVVPFILLAAGIALARFVENRGLHLLFIFLLSAVPFSFAMTHFPFEENRREFLNFVERSLPNDATLITDFEADLFTHQVGRRKNTTYVGASPEVTYVDRQLFLKGKILSPPILAATQNLQTIRALLREGKLIYLTAFEKEKFGAAYFQLAQEFSLEEKARSTHYILYKLSLSPEMVRLTEVPL